MAQTSMGVRFVWSKTGLVGEGPTLAAAQDLVVAVAHEAGVAEAPGAAPGVTPGLDPAVTKDVNIPAPGPRGSLVLSQEKESRALAGRALTPGSQSLAHALRNLALVQLTENRNPALRAAQR